MVTEMEPASATQIQLPLPHPHERRTPSQEPLASNKTSLPFRPKIPPRPASRDSTTSISPKILKRLPKTPREHSPISRVQSRPQTVSKMSPAPPMQRAYSSPGLDSTGRFISPLTSGNFRPVSPLGRTARRRSPLRTAMEEPYPVGSTWGSVCMEPNIPEHAELDITTTNPQPSSSIYEADMASMPTSSAYHTMPRSRRTPPTPLYRSGSPATLPKSNSPIFGWQPATLHAKTHAFANEPYPLSQAHSFGSTSSVSSTPTSFRSRSPSISSLETIPDTPDAEDAARWEEAECVKSRAASADNEDVDGRDLTRRSSLESRFAGKEKRKRWSVCGAERRGDFSLEVIEE